MLIFDTNILSEMSERTTLCPETECVLLFIRTRNGGRRMFIPSEVQSEEPPHKALQIETVKDFTAARPTRQSAPLYVRSYPSEEAN